MNGRVRAAAQVWRRRHSRTWGERAFIAYAVLMVALVVVVPVARVVWLSATDPAGLALLTSPDAPAAVAVIVTVAWAGALLLGRDRGPALRTPFLTHALGSSDLARREAFGAPVLVSAAVVVALSTGVAALIGAALASHGTANALDAVLFTIAGGFAGVAASVAWLAGQAMPRAAVPLALALLAMGALGAVAPGLGAFTPVGWVAAAYPPGGSVSAVAALACLAVGLLASVPALMHRLDLPVLSSQAERWATATSRVAMLEVDAAAAVYRSRPYTGRRRGAVRTGRGMAWMFVVRDAIGASRTPGRLVVGVLALAGAGALVVAAFSPTSPGAFLGATAGVLVFAGLGPFTDGIRHAASVAGDLPLYGVSDSALLALHAIFPAIAVVVVLGAAAAAYAVVGGTPIAAVVAAIVLGLVTLAARIGNALKGPLPPALLIPVPTPMGDLAAATRAVWALDGVLLAAAAGACAVAVLHAPALAVAVAGTVIAIATLRWRGRR